MVRGLGFLLLFASLIAIPQGSAQARYAALIIDADTGKVLHSVNADVPKYPASLTKIMTLYMLFDALESGKLKLGQKLKVSKRAQGMAPSKLGLKRGETISVKDAMFALITKSANDAAVVLAEALGGTEAEFAKLMTAKAREIGMTKTKFRNASGLPNRHQKSTAIDMARLAIALRKNFPDYYRHFATQKFTYRGRTYKNHNRLLKNYQGTDGIKTGYIRASGFNLVASVERNGSRLVGVVFGGKSSKSRDKHMRKLFDRGFAALAKAKVPPTPRRNPLYHSPAALKIAGSEPAADTTAPTEKAPAETAVAKTAVLITEAAPARKPKNNAVDGQVLDMRLIAPKQQASLPKPAPSAAPQQVWSVQVGAFASFAPAQVAATQAARRVPGLLLNSRLLISQVKMASGQLYRAQLTGLNEAQARSACRELKALNQECLVVQPQAAAGALTLSANQ